MSRSSFAGLVIYFCYGIHHSAEAATDRSSVETEMNGFKLDRELEAMSTEKEAFLRNGVNASEENDEDL